MRTGPKKKKSRPGSRRDSRTQQVVEMSTTEALRTQLDALRLEKQRLEVENARLREANPEGAAQTDAETEMAQCRAENERLTREAAQLQTRRAL